MSITNGPLPVEHSEVPETHVRSAAIRFNGIPYIIFRNGGSWDCEWVPMDDIPRFETLELKWEALKTRRVSSALLEKESRENEERKDKAAKRKESRERKGADPKA